MRKSFALIVFNKLRILPRNYYFNEYWNIWTIYTICKVITFLSENVFKISMQFQCIKPNREELTSPYLLGLPLSVYPKNISPDCSIVLISVPSPDIVERGSFIRWIILSVSRWLTGRKLLLPRCAGVKDTLDETEYHCSMNECTVNLYRDYNALDL